jgi:hypothetical protein
MPPPISRRVRAEMVTGLLPGKSSRATKIRGLARVDKTGEKSLQYFMRMIYFLRMKSNKAYLDALQAGATQANWLWGGIPSLGGHGVGFKSENRKFHLVLNAVSPARGPELERALADAYLRASSVTKSQPHERIPLPVVAAPSLSRAMLERLKKYAADVLPSAHWGAFDLAGTWHFPGLSIRIQADSAVMESMAFPAAVGKSPPPQHDPFSDLGQWLSKVMLAQGLSEDLVSAPRQRLRNQAALASAANVSLPTVSRWKKQLCSMAFLTDSKLGLRIVRKKELLIRWAASIRNRAYVDTWVQPVFGSSNQDKALSRLLAEEPKAILLGAAACDRLGIGVVKGAPMQIALPDHSPDYLAGLGLMPVQSGIKGAFLIRRPRYFESLRRGAVIRDGVAVADVLQCAIDSYNSPVRGMDQFEAILNRLGFSD